ncbi:MAG: hypothetical protein CVV47_03400 [Spirochaetae bacterium HGW-Spirochaetae-3]|jgi:AcrR family transcriptional regulator|nr:MAG: hypothetical protein CVV47_03400 [Spirochaetae bacterium HGW-Spirochaetae-3]
MDQIDDGIDTAERILRAGLFLLETKGYASLTMRRVGTLAGISQAAIYRHYRDKDALVFRIIGDGYADLARRLETLASGENPPDEKLLLAFRGYIDFVMEKPALFKALLLQDIGIAGSALNALGPGVSRQRRTFELLAATLREGMDTGYFERSDPETTAQVVWSAVFGLAARMAIEGVPPDRAAVLADTQLRILIRGIRP